MDNVQSIESAVTVTVRGGGGIAAEVVTVRELNWKSYLRAIKELTGNILETVGKISQTKSLNPASVVEQVALNINPEDITKAITANETLLTWVLMESTGKDQPWVDSLTASDMMKVLEKIVAMNLSDEVIRQGKSLAQRVQAAFAQKKA